MACFTTVMKKEYLIFGVVGVTTLRAGAFGGYVFGKRADHTLCDAEKASIQKDAGKFRASIVAAFPEPQQVFDVKGTIKRRERERYHARGADIERYSSCAWRAGHRDAIHTYREPDGVGKVDGPTVFCVS